MAAAGCVGEPSAFLVFWPGRRLSFSLSLFLVYAPWQFQAAGTSETRIRGKLTRRPRKLAALSFLKSWVPIQAAHPSVLSDTLMTVC